MSRSRLPAVRPETESIGCGPVELDVKMARRHGWSERQLQRAWMALREISRREGALSHRRGPVAGCPCAICDPCLPRSILGGLQLPKWRRARP